MSLGSERRIVGKIAKKLRGNGWFVLKVHGSVYQRPGIPDLMCLKLGFYMWLEVKRPGGKVSLIQEATHDVMRAHGARVAVVDSENRGVNTAEEELSRWLSKAMG